MKKLLLCAFCLFLSPVTTMAHHSFAVHFVDDELVSVQGVVTDFNFTNPHGVLLFTATDEDGNQVDWRAETNSPNVLRRRGWSRDSLKPGDRISIEGFPARREEHYMRISHVVIEGGGELFAQARAD